MTDKISDVLMASDSAIKYLANKNKIIFRYEIVGVKRMQDTWLVQIVSDFYTGIVFVRATDGHTKDIVL